MEGSTSRSRRIGHGAALRYSTGLLTVVPLALYIGLIVWANDLGGPLNLIIIPIVSAIVGFLVNLIAFRPLSLLAERFGLRRWLQSVGALCGVASAVVLTAWIVVGTRKTEGHGLVWFSVVGSLFLYFLGGFFVYLWCLSVSRRV